MTTERRAKKAKYSEQEHARRKVSFQSFPESKASKREVSKSSAKKTDVSTESATSGKEKLEPSLSSSFKVIAGSYERLLYGLQGTVSVVSPASSELQWTLKPIFIFPAHVSCIKSVAASPQGGKWLATGSGDEIIKVWDLRRRKEVGGLMQHEGSITHLTFPSRSHLISASEDGTLCLFRARDWAVLRSLKGHKGRVNSVSVHPSGKIALSVGKDRTLYMWDLMRGRRAASVKLGFEGELVRWSITGSLLIVQYQKIINVYSTDLALLHTMEHASRIHDVKFAQRVNGEGEVVLVAAEDRKTTVYDVCPDSGTFLRAIAYLIGHGNRVKALDTIRIALPSTTRCSTTLLSSVSSDGTINVYDLSFLPPRLSEGIVERSPVVQYDSKGSRLTCVTLADGDVDRLEPPVHNKGAKREREPESEDEDEWEGFETEIT
ncbi:WD40-repeat-containing domain protein [Lactarius akahatsu]|uniref:WD40-repeat-containing domain protein n=1 Tax=Lactarius akahatsu TaxID=416441 RepID=A0AAD4LFH2_9AGAM|nr:WD40-repeat-containing domain protein [Lactarius akahatsu]